MTTDASSKGWGASLEGVSTGGHFKEQEKEDHINILELQAALFGLQSFYHVLNCHFLLKIDNISAVACTNKMESVKSIPIDNVGKAMWNTVKGWFV